MYDVLFQNQAHLKDADLYRYAGEVGLTWRAIWRRWTITFICKRCASTCEGGRRSHIRATPTFFINGVVQDISFGMKALHDAVARHGRTEALP